MPQTSRSKMAEAYLTALDRLKEKVSKLEAENAKLREQLENEVRLRQQDYDRGWPGEHRLD